MCRAGSIPNRREIERGGLVEAPSLVRKRGEVSENSRSIASVSMAAPMSGAPVSVSASRAACAMRS